MTDEQTQRIYRSRDDRMLGGVAGGLASHLGIDPVLVRLSFVALAIAGIGVALYIVAWIIIPEGPDDGTTAASGRREGGPSGAQMMIGSVLVALGILFLVDWVIPIRRLLIPMALIVLGIAVMAAGRSRS